MRTTAISALCSAALMFCTGGAFAIDYNHIDRLAVRLQRKLEHLHDEVHAHFRHTSSYEHLDEDVDQMEKWAKHIHEVAHDHGSLRHLRSDVEKLDRLYHHVNRLYRRMLHRGEIRPHAARHFYRALRQIGRTLHHLRDDLFHLDHDTDRHFSVRVHGRWH